MHIGTIEKFRTSLHNWYATYQRNLPWRNIKDPYKIWVSEIILQQTTVEQGLAYYLRFVEKFNTINELADAPEQEVLKLWQGLGYYSRARNMHKTAQLIVNDNGGVFPNNFQEIIKLKGIGPYTAAAILSFAYNLPYPVIDGNVMRVMARIFAVEEPINSTIGKKIIVEHTNLLFDTKNPEGYNQAVMEFGAIHCKVRNPLCNNCFASELCVAFQKNIQHLLPVKTQKLNKRNRYFFYLVPLIKEKNTVRTYIKKRSEKDIWHNLYDFIVLENEGFIPPESLLKSKLFKDFFNQFGIKTRDICTLNCSEVIIHKLTHQTINAQFLTFESLNISLPGNYIKVALNEINTYPLPKLIENYIKKNVLFYAKS